MTQMHAAEIEEMRKICRATQLLELGFQFDAEAAEWQRWFNHLAGFQAGHGHCNPSPLASSTDLVLLNWCASVHCPMHLVMQSPLHPSDF